MNPLDNLIAELERVVSGSAAMSEVMPVQTGWIDYGFPPENGPYPCVRLDGLVSLDDKQNRYLVNVKLWSMDMRATFFTDVETLRSALDGSSKFQIEGYVHQPDTGRNCAIFQVTFIP